MEFTVSRPELLRAIEAVHGVVERSPSRMILLNLRIAVKHEIVTVSATDGKIFVQSSLAAPGGIDGELSVPATDLMDMLKTLPTGNVTFATDENNWATLACGKSRFHLPGLPANEFPRCPSLPDGLQGISVSSAQFVSLMDKSAFAISEDENRPALCGLFLESTGEVASLTSTDGHRLAHVNTKKLDLPDGFSLLIPRKTVRELRRLLSGYSGDVQIFQSGDLQHYRLGATELTSKNIAATFPNFRQVFPASYTHTVRFERSMMVDTLRRVMLIEKSGSVKLNFTGSVMRITAENPEKGQLCDEMEVEYTGDSLQVCYNPRYFIEILGCMGTKHVTLNVADPMGPGVLLEDTENDPRLFYILMPMKLR